MPADTPVPEAKGALRFPPMFLRFLAMVTFSWSLNRAIARKLHVMLSESMPLEVLNVAFVLLRGFPRSKCAEVSAFSRTWICFTRIEPILARFEFANHVVLLFVSCSTSLDDIGAHGQSEHRVSAVLKLGKRSSHFPPTPAAAGDLQIDPRNAQADNEHCMSILKGN
jgi:hypothetical protein